jgi:hypothetical protein
MEKFQAKNISGERNSRWKNGIHYMQRIVCSGSKYCSGNMEMDKPLTMVRVFID